MTEPAVLLRDFVNTFHVAVDIDDLDSPAALTDWLAGRGLLLPGAPVAGPSDVAVAAALREGLRAAMLENQRAADRALRPELERALAALPLRVTFASGGPSLVPATEGVAAGLAALAAAIVMTVTDGTWPRLKACQDDTCRAAFLDTSKNRSRAWCSMQVCGNRTKTRAYRARRRGTVDRHL